MSYQLIRCLLVSAALLVSAGCGESRNSASVTGRVTIGGEPAKDLIVRFQPAETGDTEKIDAGMGSFGTTDEDGYFTMRFSDDERKGAMIGDHRVVIDERTAPEQEDVDAGDIGREVVSRIPAKWRDGSQRFTVRVGSNEANFELKD